MILLSKSKKKPGKKLRKVEGECFRWLELLKLFKECGENTMTLRNLRKGRRKEKRKERRGREKEKRERKNHKQIFLDELYCAKTSVIKYCDGTSQQFI